MLEVLPRSLPIQPPGEDKDQQMSGPKTYISVPTTIEAIQFKGTRESWAEIQCLGRGIPRRQHPSSARLPA